MARVLVLGGSVDGLAAAEGLARHGHEAIVVEREAVTGLRCGRTDEGVLQVIGADLENGTHVDADVTLDCLGSQSPVPAWLAEHDVPSPAPEHDYDAACCTGYVRLTDRDDVAALLDAKPIS